MQTAVRAQTLVSRDRKHKAERSPLLPSSTGTLALFRAGVSRKGVVVGSASSPERLSGRNEREAKSPSPLASSVTSGEPSVSDEAGKQECDIFRDSMLRYAGYSNEVGEAFRKFIGSRAVLLSYAIATLYCASDSVAKGVSAFQSTRQSQATGSADEQVDTGSCVANAIKAIVDTFMWQMLASVIIPGFLINRVVYVAGIASYTIIPDHDEIYANALTIDDDLDGRNFESYAAPAVKALGRSEQDSSNLLQSGHHHIKRVKKEIHGRFGVRSHLDFVREYIPTMTGLAAIPFIIKPIDNAVDYAMDRTVRKLPFWWKEEEH